MSYAHPGKAGNSITTVILQLVDINFGSDSNLCPPGGYEKLEILLGLTQRFSSFQTVP